MARLNAHRVIAGSLALLLAILSAAASARPAGAAGPTVAVALFYAPTPVVTYLGVIPEEFAAADLSAVLAAASGGRLTVLPRDRVRAEEYALRWNEADVLRFARLESLAHALGADRVVVGWIRQFGLDTAGGGGSEFEPGGDSGGMLQGLAVVVYQVFDATQGRIVYETQVEGHAVGAIRSSVAQATLDDAARRAVAQLLGPLTAGTATP